MTAPFERLRAHDFHPLQPERRTVTVDRTLGAHGVADPDDRDGRVRSLALRDLVALAADDPPAVARGLADDDLNVRVLAAAALGVARVHDARAPLERTVVHDPEPIVRAYAAIALGEMGSEASVPLLHARLGPEPDADVRHQLELAAAQVASGRWGSDAQREAFASLREEGFGRVRAGEVAPDFALADVDGRPWRLHEGRGRWQVLLWIFADWCPVCHREFAELMDARADFERLGVRLATLEAHDAWRGRLMVGREIQPALWGSRSWFRAAYTERIWWSHLPDLAGAVGARYGTEPMTFAVHAEFVQRPTTVIVDPEGVVRFAYAGSFWGDRPSVGQVLDLIRRRDFTFVHPRRLAPPVTDGAAADGGAARP
ncbi:MAG: redoxin domain-containing protein [Trueperaceae bacterium]|nr:redoxin domain-containing protein [Trueperaceae bacterium]